MINLKLRDDLAKQHWEAIEGHLKCLSGRNAYNLTYLQKKLQLVFTDGTTLKEIILASPSRLKEIAETFSKHPDYLADKKKFVKLFSCFGTNYNKLNSINDPKFQLKNGEGYNGHTIINNLGLQVCPYCNRNHIGYIKERKKAIHQMDHYYPQAEYPILALSFYNLVPCCAACNKLKGTTYPKFPNPYDSNVNLQECFKFRLRPSKADFLTNDEGVDLDLISLDNNELAKDFDAVFHLNDAYQIHKRDAREALMLHHVYNETFLKELERTLELTGNNSTAMLKEMVFASQPVKDDISQRALGKLIYDILEDADLLF